MEELAGGCGADDVDESTHRKQHDGISSQQIGLDFQATLTVRFNLIDQDHVVRVLHVVPGQMPFVAICTPPGVREGETTRRIVTVDQLHFTFFFTQLTQFHPQLVINRVRTTTNGDLD